jgi:UDP-2,3-diacylglucosamine pyrophosphatase LpxH
MAHDRLVTHKKLSSLWRNKDIPVLTTKDRPFVMMSDLHLGDGGRADDARENERIILAALAYYRRKKYSLILLGDIEEFWQFTREEIVKRYRNTIYRAIKSFGDEQVYRIFGNHDREWAASPDPVRNDPHRFLPATEAIKLRDGAGRVRMLLVHGHQGDEAVYRHPWRTRFFVRLYRLVEPYLKFDRHTSAAHSQITNEYERIMYSWAKQEQVILICGHSHHAIFASQSYAERLRTTIATLEAEMVAKPIDHALLGKKNRIIKQLNQELREEMRVRRDIDAVEAGRTPLPCYYNAGCALYTDGITLLELADGELRLVKWQRGGRRRPPYEIYARGSLRALDAAIRSHRRGSVRKRIMTR